MRTASLQGSIFVLATCVGCASAPPSSPPRPTFEVPMTASASQPSELLLALSSSDSATRAAAAWALASATGSQSAFSAGLQPLRSDPERSVRYAAAWALGRLNGPTEITGAKPDEIPPKPKRHGYPVYPSDAFSARIEGTVLIEALIGEHGEVAYAEVRESVPKLDAAALKAARQWEFEPMRVGGVPRATVIRLPIAFRIY